jgi:AcrR family transcriptional regulator
MPQKARELPELENTPVRRELRKSERKAAIEKASKEIFLEKGYTSASVDEIARVAGVTKRTLYSYYPSKLALFVHVFDEYLQELAARVTEAASGDAPIRERLIKTLNALFDFTRENEKFMWLYWMLDSGEADGILPKELLDHVKGWTDSMFRATIKMVMAGQKEGIIRDIDPKLLVHMMSALNKGIIVHTNKERRFEIEDIDARSLQALSIELLNGGVFDDRKSTGKASKSPKAKKS